jgi:hypothetical protein
VNVVSGLLESLTIIGYSMSANPWTMVVFSYGYGTPGQLRESHESACCPNFTMWRKSAADSRYADCTLARRPVAVSTTTLAASHR